MTTMTRLVPFRSSLTDVAVLQNRLNSIFQDFHRPAGEMNESLGAGNFIPPVDVYEDDQKLVLKLEVPGIREADLDLQVENQTLTVRGERRFETGEKEENFHRIERRFGTFVRSFTLPASIDTGSISARYEQGVLAIELAKKEVAKPRQIRIGIQSAPAAQQSPEAKTVDAR